MTRPVDLAGAEHDLAAMVRDGMSIGEIAEETGLSYAAARKRLRRQGLQAIPLLQRSIRERAEAMRPLDAVNYLLNVIECLGASMTGDWHPLDDHGLTLTPGERRIMICLHEAKGEARSLESICSAASVGGIGDGCDLSAVRVMISKMRSKMPAHVRIKTHWGYGYSLKIEAAA